MLLNFTSAIRNCICDAINDTNFNHLIDNSTENPDDKGKKQEREKKIQVNIP